MKKLLCLALCLLLMPWAALAEDLAADTLLLSEIMDLMNHYHELAMDEAPLNDPAADLTEEGYRFVYPFVTLYADTAIMSQDTVVNTVVLTSAEAEGPRGVCVEDDINAVLSAFYTENGNLAGTRESAVIYNMDMLPEVYRWAEVQRDGQRVHTIQYAVHQQMTTGSEGYTDAGVIFTMNENMVDAIRIYGANSRVPAEAVDEVLANMNLKALENAYTQMPFSYDGAALEKFGPQDLLMSGLDFLSCTPEDAIAVLGDPISDTWMDDGENGCIRTLVFEAGEMVFTYDVNKQNPAVYMLLLTTGGFEGPRCVRVGDSFASIFNRFRNGEGDYEDTAELLYGSLDGSEYGVAEYGDAMTLRYGFTLADGTQVVLHLTFGMTVLQEIMLYVAN